MPSDGDAGVPTDVVLFYQWPGAIGMDAGVFTLTSASGGGIVLTPQFVDASDIELHPPLACERERRTEPSALRLQSAVRMAVRCRR